MTIRTARPGSKGPSANAESDGRKPRASDPCGPDRRGRSPVSSHMAGQRGRAIPFPPLRRGGPGGWRRHDQARMPSRCSCDLHPPQSPLRKGGIACGASPPRSPRRPPPPPLAPPSRGREMKRGAPPRFRPDSSFGRRIDFRRWLWHLRPVRPLPFRPSPPHRARPDKTTSIRCLQIRCHEWKAYDILRECWSPAAVADRAGLAWTVSANSIRSRRHADGSHEARLL